MRKKRFRRVLSSLAALAMLLTLLPTAALAAGEAETYQKIDTEEAFTTGTYLMVLDSGYAVGALDGSWLSAVEQTNTEETIHDPEPPS